MFNLLEIWQNGIAPDLKKEKEEAASTGSKFDDAFIQSSFEFSKPPSIVFIKDIHTTEPTNYYGDLPPVALQPFEKQAIKENLIKLRTNPHFYDGDQLLITGVKYDEASNTLYLEAKRAKYSFLHTLSNKKFPENSPIYQQRLYRTGVLTPFITKDDYTFFIERTNDKLYSAASGFLEPIGKRNKLKPKLWDLVTYTAIKESIEEFLGDDNNMRRVKFSKPEIKSISFRASKSMGYIEFVAPCNLDCYKENVEHIIQNNRAVDSYEHTGQFVAIPLDPSSRDEAIAFLKQGASKYHGTFLYNPMLVSSCIKANRLFQTIPATLPHTRTKVVPISSLSQKPQKPLSLLWHPAQIHSSNKSEKDSDNLIQNNLKLTKRR